MTDEQKVNALISIHTSAGLQVVYEVLEKIALESETELLQAKPGDKELIAGLHSVAHGQRIMFQLAQERIEFMCKEGKVRPIPPKRLSPEEQALDNAELNIGPEDIQ